VDGFYRWKSNASHSCSLRCRGLELNSCPMRPQTLPSSSMSIKHSDQSPLEVRFIVACPRSGSTLVMRVFAEAITCVVTSRLVLKGNYGRTPTFQPDYSILENTENHNAYLSAMAAGKRFLINKEELGRDWQQGECDYNVFADISTYDIVKPAFLFRDPIRIFDSWKNVGWLDMEGLTRCYMNMHRMMKASTTSSSVIYERLIYSPHAEIEALCSWWGVQFDDNMLRFRQPFGSFWFNSEREKKIYCEENPLGLFTTVQTYQTIVSSIPCHSLVSNDEKEQLENTVGRLYMSLWKDKVEEIRTILQTKTWFAFDLDDTLHEFRKASGAAVSAVLRIISQKYLIPIDELRTAYSRVLKQATAAAFTDGKMSHEYRKERFSAVLEGFSIVPSDGLLDELADTYDMVLEDSLELKCGAMSLLTHLKAMGKKIAVITEGPQDAQERTLKALKLDDKIDFLATTNFFRVSKVDGFLGKVLEELEIEASDMAYIGDSKERDMIPAAEHDIYAIHYTEMENFSLDLYPPQINTLKKLEHILLAQ
jgi:FMN phosphatase YigB (HAD superfamily)